MIKVLFLLILLGSSLNLNAIKFEFIDENTCEHHEAIRHFSRLNPEKIKGVAFIKVWIDGQGGRTYASGHAPTNTHTITEKKENRNVFSSRLISLTDSGTSPPPKTIYVDSLNTDTDDIVRQLKKKAELANHEFYLDDDFFGNFQMVIAVDKIVNEFRHGNDLSQLLTDLTNQCKQILEKFRDLGNITHGNTINDLLMEKASPACEMLQPTNIFQAYQRSVEKLPEDCPRKIMKQLRKIKSLVQSFTNRMGEENQMKNLHHRATVHYPRRRTKIQP